VLAHDEMRYRELGRLVVIVGRRFSRTAKKYKNGYAAAGLNFIHSEVFPVPRADSAL
jgi:hypothetical protein